MRVNLDNHKEYIKFLSEQKEPDNAILFYGSSTFTCWGRDRIRQQLVPFTIINHGFGGSTAEEALYYYHSMVKPYNPAALVWYEGDNDLAIGYNPDEIFYLSVKVFEWARYDFPNLPIFIIPVKDCLSRRENAEKRDEYNKMMKDYSDKTKNIFYIGIDKLLYDKDGSLRNDIFLPDNLHFNDQGYIELSKIVYEALKINLKID